MKDKVMKNAAISCTIMTIVLVVVLLFYIQNRTITYTSGGTLNEDEVVFSEEIGKLGNEEPIELMTKQVDGSRSIVLPLLDNITEDKIALTADIYQKNVTIYLDDVAEDFFNNQQIQIDGEVIQSTQYTYEAGITKLCFQLTGIYECEVAKENGKLRLKFLKPEEKYDFIVVVDVGHGQEDYGENANGIVEKEILLKVANQLKTLNQEQNVGLYFTRLEDTILPVEDKVKLIAELGADLLLSLHLTKDENQELYGINLYYDDNYFFTGFSSLQLADILARHVAMAVCGRANGLYGAKEDCIVKSVHIPATEIELGYVSNVQEAGLLADEKYQKRIAQGIMEGILEAYQLVKEEAKE